MDGGRERGESGKKEGEIERERERGGGGKREGEIERERERGGGRVITRKRGEEKGRGVR